MGANSSFELVPRDGPLIISIPHLGQHIPVALRECYSAQALLLEDTDWHLDRLYEFAEQLDATVIAANVSRYVVDLNRPATGESLYPGMIITSLCPSETFRGVPIYQPGRDPDELEIACRVDTYWRPYHEQLKAELSRLRARHPRVLLWEAHSIASVLPRLFTGKLPDFNFGTSDGESCDASVVDGALEAVRDSQRSWVLNGRFRGGFITRRYGNPDAGVHAIQLEMCQSLYMDEAVPFAWRQDKAAAVIPTVRSAVEGALRRMTQQPRATPPERTAMLSG